MKPCPRWAIACISLTADCFWATHRRSSFNSGFVKPADMATSKNSPHRRVPPVSASSSAEAKRMTHGLEGCYCCRPRRVSCTLFLLPGHIFLDGAGLLPACTGTRGHRLTIAVRCCCDGLEEAIQRLDTGAAPAPDHDAFEAHSAHSQKTPAVQGVGMNGLVPCPGIAAAGILRRGIGRSTIVSIMNILSEQR